MIFALTVRQINATFSRSEARLHYVHLQMFVQAVGLFPLWCNVRQFKQLGYFPCGQMSVSAISWVISPLVESTTPSAATTDAVS